MKPFLLALIWPTSQVITSVAAWEQDNGIWWSGWVHPRAGL